MPEQAESILNPSSLARFRNHSLQVGELLGERIRRELFKLAEALAVGPHAASGEIERDCPHSGFRKRAREVGEECPVGKSFEPVADDDGAKPAGRGLRMICLAADDERLSASGPFPRELELFCLDQASTSP